MQQLAICNKNNNLTVQETGVHPGVCKKMLWHVVQNVTDVKRNTGFEKKTAY